MPFARPKAKEIPTLILVKLPGPFVTIKQLISSMLLFDLLSTSLTTEAIVSDCLSLELFDDLKQFFS